MEISNLILIFIPFLFHRILEFLHCHESVVIVIVSFYIFLRLGFSREPRMKVFKTQLQSRLGKMIQSRDFTSKFPPSLPNSIFEDYQTSTRKDLQVVGERKAERKAEIKAAGKSREANISDFRMQDDEMMLMGLSPQAVRDRRRNLDQTRRLSLRFDFLQSLHLLLHDQTRA